MSLRVLMTTDAVGGVWNFCMQLCTGLLHRDPDTRILLACMGPTPDDVRRKQVPPAIRLEIKPYRLEWMPDPWDDVDEAGDWLLQLAMDFRPDVIHLNTLAHGQLEWPAPVLSVGHSCVCSWYRAVRGKDAPCEWNPYRERVRTSLQASDMVAAPSSWMLESLQYDYGPFRDPMIIRNGCEPRPLGRHKHNLILCAGRLWDEAKNTTTLTRAARNLPWPVLLAGTHADSSPAKANTIMLGQLSTADMAEQYARASIYCHPARYEPFGLGVLEAAQAGCALVLGDNPSLREHWNQAALFVPPNDSDRLHQALNQLISNPRLRAHLSQRAHNRARTLPTDAMVFNYRKQYRRLHQAKQVLAGQR